MRTTGIYKSLGNIKFFIPDPLPPQNPPLQLDLEIMKLHGQAMQQLGELNEMTRRVPDKTRFIKAYVNKEALLSSSIEGVDTTLRDLFTQTVVTTKPDKNTQLVMNYTKALHKSCSLIREDNLPIASRVILSAHRELMQIGEGDKANPGNYRKQTVTVGNLVPPPASEIPELMADLEKYINNDQTTPPLIKAGLTHVQFETIHPFLDGNGRIGRLLIVLMLVESGILLEPIIYPSYYFKKRRYDYYKLLDAIRTAGDFEGWIKYYLSVIRDSSADACARAKDIDLLEERIADTINKEKATRKIREAMLGTVPILFCCPVITIKELSSQLETSYNTASKIISRFVSLGFLVEQDQRKRGKLFAFEPYFEVLKKEYEL